MTQEIKKSGVVIIVCGISALCVLALIMLYFQMRVRQSTSNLHQYVLENGFVRDDVTRVIQKMKEDPDFKFYFELLNNRVVVQGGEDAYAVLSAHREEKSLLTQIMIMQKHVLSFATLVNAFDIPEDFIEQQDQYEDLNEIFRNLLYEDFKLAVLGVCYKATFDEHFAFKWDKDTLLAANKIQELSRQGLNLWK
jgi:hypothetical protein